VAVRAMRFDRYGVPTDVLELRDVDIPLAGNDGVLVRVRAASLNPADWHLVNGVPHVSRPQIGLRSPKVSGLGVDFAGEVVEVGPAVTSVRSGDEVYGRVDPLPGTNVPTLGSAAEYVRVTEGAIRPKPTQLSWQEAATVPLAATTALHGLRDVAGVQPGQRVLINGASGGVGTFAVQIAAALGAEVTAVCSTPNIELVRSLGAGQVIDYTREDPTRVARDLHVVLDNVGNHPASAWRRTLTRGGTYVASFGRKEARHIGPMGRIVGMLALGSVSPQRFVLLPTTWKIEHLDTISDLIASGQLRPVIDRTFELAAAAEGLTYVGEGHARGKVVVVI
jgi:NADPH:quinone reductase-like Zn-dependent oxidoreductase